MPLIDIMKGFGAVDMTDMKWADLVAMFDGADLLRLFCVNA